jgi:hypothetical protein
MRPILAEAWGERSARNGAVHDVTVRSEDTLTWHILIPVAAFGLYWLSSLILAARDERYLFGADTALYMELAKGGVIERLGGSYALDRITRFHPLTTAMAVAWMKALSPLTLWITPPQLLKAMFSMVGAIGAGAATVAFAAVAPRRQAPLWGLIYAISLGVWYFSSIEESKIVTATLAAAYIAAYLHLRKHWTARGAALLTAILLLACLNEIIAAFLVVIPAVDTLMQRGWNLRCYRWMVWHGLAVPVAFAFLEMVVKRHTGAAAAAGPALEGASHLSMLLFYVSQNDFSAATLYSFAVNWLFFSVAAPTAGTTLAPTAWPEYTAYFEAALRNYLASPVSASLVALFAVMLVASALPRFRGKDVGNGIAIVMALLAYALLRGTFWFIVNPSECFLFSSGTTLAHMLVLAIPFGRCRLPGKQAILAACAFLLFIINGTFMIGP